MSTDLRKAAVLLLSLPEDEAALLLSLLEPSLVEAVSVEIARIDRVAQSEQEDVATTFKLADHRVVTGSSSAGRSGGLERVEAMLGRALGSDAAEVIEYVRRAIDAPPMGFLKDIDGRTLLTLLYDEHPQTIAIVLSHLSIVRSAEVLAGLPATQRLIAVARLATMGPIRAEIVRDVEYGLMSHLAEINRGQFLFSGGAARAAEILRLASPDVEQSLLSGLAQNHPELADEIGHRIRQLKQYDAMPSRSAA